MRVFGNFRFVTFLAVLAVTFGAFAPARPALAQVTAFKQAVAEAAARDADIATFYRTNNYQPIWTAADDASRARRAVVGMTAAPAHGGVCVCARVRARACGGARRCALVCARTHMRGWRWRRC